MALFHELRLKQNAYLSADLHQLCYVQLGCCMYDGCKSLVHVPWRPKEDQWFKHLPKFFYCSQPTINLIAHSCHHIEDGHHCFFVDEGLCPDFGVDFLPRLKMFAYFVLVFGNFGELFAPVNVESRLCLAQVSAAFDLIKLLSHNNKLHSSN